ncbi:tetratricopeptide repeat protein [Jiangella rhizosphaerae]|uniref:Tetratricopeptide repeat protein n=2 Tax=Jiangella rhizosphaerae TaxID=2293569 RepID=A0A418KGY6_9ACTN|nr:tetratricopeptide repeat protein [Jiangella rhizosphaerae]
MQLRTWRREDGDPSFGEIARRVGALRAKSGTAAGVPGRSTVYDCFRDGRRRIDVALVVDIARALHVPDEQVPEWRARCVAARHPKRRELPVAVQRGRPVRVEPFTRRLDAILPETSVLITGMPGVGKTQAATDLACRLIDRGRTADALVLGLRGGDEGAFPSADSIVDAACSALGARATGSLGDRVRTLGDALRAHRCVLVVDDASHVDQVAPLLAGMGGVPVIVTSRVALELPGCLHLPLVRWEVREIVELIAGIAGARRIAGERDAAERIAELVDGIPLAAAVVAARVRDDGEWSLSDVVDALQEDLGAVDDAVHASIAATYRVLDAQARRLLRYAAMQPCADLTIDQLGALVDLDAADAEQVVAVLEASYLMHRGPSGRAAMHALVRSFAAARARREDPPRARHAALDRLAARFIGEAWSVAAQRAGQAEPGASRFGTDLVELTGEDVPEWPLASGLSAAQLVLERAERNRSAVIDLAEACAPTFEHSGMGRLAMQLSTRAVEAARHIGDREGEARAELSIGSLAVRRGESDARTHLERARVLARDAGVSRLELRAVNSLAVHAAQSGDLAEALTQFRTAHAVAKEHGFDDVEPMLLDNIGITLRRLGRLDEALESAESAYLAALALGHVPWAASALSNLSEVQLLLGDAKAAEASATRAIELAGHFETRVIHAYAATNLGAALAAQGRFAEAILRHGDALRLAEGFGWPDLEASVLVNLAHARLATGAPEDRARTREILGRAVELSEGFPMERGRALHALGLVALQEDDPERAEKLFRDALAVIGAASGPEAQRIRTDLETQLAL